MLVISDDARPFDPDVLSFHRWLRARDGWADYVMYGVVGTPTSPCDISRPGERYADLAEWTGGRILDICSPDWGSVFDTIAEDVARQPRFFPLSQDPWEAPLVLVGDPPTPLAAELWDYDPERNGIVFVPGAVITPGTRIAVRYRSAL